MLRPGHCANAYRRGSQERPAQTARPISRYGALRRRPNPHFDPALLMNPTSPKKILIADDEVYMLRLLEMTFKKGGYTVISCRNGQEALAMAGSSLPQLIVMDVMMPG